MNFFLIMKYNCINKTSIHLSRSIGYSCPSTALLNIVYSNVGHPFPPCWATMAHGKTIHIWEEPSFPSIQSQALPLWRLHALIGDTQSHTVGLKLTHGKIIHSWAVQSFPMNYVQCHFLRALTGPRLYALCWDKKSLHNITSAKREHPSFSTPYILPWFIQHHFSKMITPFIFHIAGSDIVS